MNAMPSRGDLLLAYYADDFTGATDVLESLARAGVPTALFLDPPSPRRIAAYGPLRGFGVAGTSRTMSPAQMAEQLPPVFRSLAAAKPRHVHYKICSTFDSSPRIGSIGRAIDLAAAVLRPPFVPLLVGAPILGRYCLFGNLFARSGLDSEPHRLDRHPTMAEHPTTPMDESDLRLHLGRQTDAAVGLLDVTHLEDLPAARRRLAALVAGGSRIVLLDVLTDAHLQLLGRLLDAESGPGRRSLLVGSSAVEYALVATWRDQGLLPPPPAVPRLRTARSLVVVSGSCSPVTDRQIARAVEAGFAAVAVDTAALAVPATRSAAIAAALTAADRDFAAGRSVIFHTARGPRDRRLAQTRKRLAARRLAPAATLGSALGELLDEALRRTGWTRGGVTGGDTSGHAARALGLEALEFAAPLAPGSPLCLARAPGRTVDGREIFFKGGQNGRDDFFLTAVAGDRRQPSRERTP
jgi:uncharacterized protein YgbK (DUF1537 family)